MRLEFNSGAELPAAPIKKYMKQKILQHKILAVLFLALAMLALVRFVTGPDNGSGATPRGARTVYVELGQASFGTMREVGQYYGTLSAAQKFSVSPKVGGELKQLMVDIGDRISSGQILARLDDETYRLTRDQALHNVRLAEAQKAEAEANLSLAESDLARQASLIDKRITTQSEYETYQNKKAQAQARLMLAESQLSVAESQLADAALRLSYTEINATWPEEGPRWIGERLADEGDLLTANTPFLSVVSLNPLLVVVEVIERDYPKIRNGQVAELRTEAFPGEVFTGRVVRVAPVLSANTRQARVELEVSNKDLRLKPGMFTEVRFIFKEVENVWSVPQDVPFQRAEGLVIFVADPDNGTVKLQTVELGLVEDGRVELVGSPPIDGPVVFLGQHLLEDGQAYSVPGGSYPGKAPGK